MSAQLEIGKIVATSGHFNSNISAPSGSVSSPGIVPIDDGNTGIYFPSVDSISVATSGTQRLNINSAGFVGIGTAGTSGRSLILSRQITGNIGSIGLLQQGSVQSDVTNNVIGYYNIMNIASSAFTLPIYSHFTTAANPPAGGAAVTTQIGYHASVSTTGASSNWGFRGALSSASNNWNIYMDGAAQNYIAGNVGIGTGKSVPSSALDVNGLITATSGNFTSSLTVNSLSIDSNSLRSKTISVFKANDNQPPATNFATLDTRNSILVLEFDAATEESAYFIGVIDETRSLTNGITVRIWWMGDTATSGNVRWGVQFEKTGTDLDTDSFDTNAQVTSAANATSGIESVASITITTIDSLVAGDRYRLRVYRVAADATNDTMTGDAQLVAVEVRAV